VSCDHLTEANTPDLQSTEGCQDCLAQGRTDWVHLRACLTCGRVGCCDSSPQQHASHHFAETSHPVIRSIQPGESWRWCFVDEEIG
jgi:uncharacterized UBP type Zn finger protein